MDSQKLFLRAFRGYGCIYYCDPNFICERRESCSSCPIDKMSVLLWRIRITRK